MSLLTDPLAGLSDDSDDDSDAGSTKSNSDDTGVKQPYAPARKAPDQVKQTINFEDLEKAGWETEDLQKSSLYEKVRGPTREEQEHKRRLEEDSKKKDEEENAEKNAEDMARAQKQAAEMEALMRNAGNRDREKAGVKDKETVRQKNKRKEKLGQAKFTLKDDRDCNNPFIEQSNDAHVQKKARR